MKVLMIAPNCDATDVGEAWCAHRWVANLARRRDVQVTLLTQSRPGRLAPEAQLPGVEVVSFPEWMLPSSMERLQAMAKPGFLVFARRVRQWIADAHAAGRTFDIAHQVTPLALRYPSPLAGAGIPYVLGPYGGSLPTPAGFAAECRSAALMTRLRQLDGLRLRFDPWLRASLAGASAVIGVAPYVARILQGIPLKRFEVMSELGIDDLPPGTQRMQREPGRLRLLHVGRGVRTKGLRDAIRALALLKNFPGITLDSAGKGEEIALCRAEAERLGVADRVYFHGQITREAVENLYRQSDVFFFPSFREPSGSVLFEAMRHGLCIVTADRGGPGHVVTPDAGFTITPDTPEQFARDLAATIRRLARDDALRARLGNGARRRVSELGDWPVKTERLVNIYSGVVDMERRKAQAA